VSILLGLLHSIVACTETGALADYVREVERQTQRLAEATAQVEALAPETKPCARLYHCLQAVRAWARSPPRRW
jgi:hypothetical protein